MIIEKFCNICKKKISERETDIKIKEYKELIKSKDYCENCQPKSRPLLLNIEMNNY